MNLEINKRFNQAGLQIKNLSDLSQFNKIKELVKIEEYFFVMATNKVREWLKESGKTIPAIQSFASKLDDPQVFIKEERDTNEHERNYYKEEKTSSTFLPKLRKDQPANDPKNFVRKSVHHSLGSVQCNATSSLYSPDNVLSGNRLNVQTVIIVVKEIYQKIEKMQDDLIINNQK